VSAAVDQGRLIVITREGGRTIRTSSMSAEIVTLIAAMMGIFAQLASSPESVE
jgi:hypothetical protein